MLFLRKTILPGEDNFSIHMHMLCHQSFERVVVAAFGKDKALVLHILSIDVKIEELYWPAAATHYLRGQETMGRRLEKNKLHC